MYKKASKLKLRVETSKGLLSVEQLWTLSLSELDELAVTLEENIEKSTRKSFLVEKTDANKLAQLKFDIVFDILSTKLEEAKASSEARNNKEYNEKIMSLIAQKETEALQGKSVDELKSMLK